MAPPSLTLAVHDDPAAAEQRSLSPGANGALMAPPMPPPPIDAVPIGFAAPQRGAPPPPDRAEPWWIRTRLFRHLRLRIDLPLHFVAEKTVTLTDLDPHQNRFRVPTDGVQHTLRRVLSPEDLAAANLLDDKPPHSPPPSPPPPTQGDQPQQAVREKRPRRIGKKHGGLPVLVVDHDAGIKELQLARWESSGGTVIKGEGYSNFFRRCSFKLRDVVEIWAFKEKRFHHFGVDMSDDGPLYLVITKKEQLPEPPPLPIYSAFPCTVSDHHDADTE